MHVIHGLLNFVGRVMLVAKGVILPELAEILRKIRFEAEMHIIQCRPQIRVQLICFGKPTEDIGDEPDTNFRASAKAVLVMPIRSILHDHTKCLLDDLLGASARVLVSFGY